MNIKKNVVLILICLFFINIKAQYQDLGAFYHIGVETNLGKRWNFKLKEELRFNSNVSILDKHFTDLQIKFKHTKWLNYKLGARYFFNRTKDNLWHNALRVNMDITVKPSFKKFTVFSRTRIQIATDAENTIGRPTSDDAILREKIGLSYSLKKYNLKPYFTGEIFLEDVIILKDKPSMKLVPNQYRLKIGTEWKYKKQHKFDFFIGYEQEMNEIFNQMEFLVGIGYVYKIKFKKKSK